MSYFTLACVATGPNDRDGKLPPRRTETEDRGGDFRRNQEHRAGAEGRKQLVAAPQIPAGSAEAVCRRVAG